MMAKYIYLIRSQKQVEIQKFKSHIMDGLVPRLLQMNPEKLKVDITEPKRPMLTVLPLKKTHLAMISVWDAQTDRAQQWQSAMTNPDWSLAGYQVTESTPRAYTKDWKDGEASPGIVMLTLMNKNPRLSYEQFMKEWFEHHTPVIALRVHPLWNYIRNVVDSIVVEGSPPLDGIVEEHFRYRRDITNPLRFFGGPLKMLPNMIKVGLHAKKFLDLSLVENYLLAEYHIRS
jgi:hypothetical protein